MSEFDISEPKPLSVTEQHAKGYHWTRAYRGFPPKAGLWHATFRVRADGYFNARGMALCGIYPFVIHGSNESTYSQPADRVCKKCLAAVSTSTGSENNDD